MRQQPQIYAFNIIIIPFYHHEMISKRSYYPSIKLLIKIPYKIGICKVIEADVSLLLKAKTDYHLSFHFTLKNFSVTHWAGPWCIIWLLSCPSIRLRWHTTDSYVSHFIKNYRRTSLNSTRNDMPFALDLNRKFIQKKIPQICLESKNNPSLAPPKR